MREILRIETTNSRAFNFYTDEVEHDLIANRTIFQVKTKRIVYNFPLANIILIKIFKESSDNSKN